MENRIKLSVIIPAYNAGSTISQQLEALRLQEWSKPWEVVVVNNRSTDNTVEVVNSFRGKIPSLRVIDAPEKAGPAYALNRGVRESRGEWLAFCDADDVVSDGWVAAMGDALAEHELVSGPFETGRLNTHDFQRHRLNPQPCGIQEYCYPPYLQHAATANLGVRRYVFDALGGFDETMLALQDTDFCWRAQLNGVKLVAVPDAVLHYRFRSDITGLVKQAFSYAVNNVRIYKKYRAHGMPKLGIRRGIVNWIDLALGIHELARPETKANWLWNAGWLAGRLYASIKYRVFAL
jgi:glycosyltransferase involved in cell wall biosynthesis